ncbi:MAG: phosphotransferase [Acidobacteria bacterium]|nr:phosphotransferase [Acidobacteriota bacterium]
MSTIPTWETISADWVAGHIGAPLGLSLRMSPVGTGQVAECRRLELLDGDLVIASVVAKMASSDPTSAATAAAQRLYLRETSFYRELAPDIGTPTPTCYFSDYDDSDQFILLLEDLSPATPIDQFQGLTREHVERGLRALAALHVPTMQRPELFAAGWLGGTKAALAPLYQAILPGLFSNFQERFAHADPDVLTLVAEFTQRLGTYSTQRSDFECVVHGDFRTDNLIFEGRGGEVPLAVVDWQTVSVSSPFLDVAYFLVTSVEPDELIAQSHELLALYCDARARLNSPVPFDIATRELARYALQPVAMLVPAAVIVERTERGDRMFLEMLRRATTVCREWNSLEELDRHAAA